MPALLCSVRDCALPLTRQGGAFLCSRGHSFDVARSGYVNLLQPQDRRSRDAGDSRAAVEARRRLADAGHDAWLLEPVRDVLDGAASDAESPAVLDLGCGEGFLLG